MAERTYLCIDEIWEEVVGHLTSGNANKVPSRAGGCTEELGVGLRLACIDSPLLLNTVRKVSPSYAAAELLWYLVGTDDVAPLLPFAPSYHKFAEANGKAHGAYGRRLSGPGYPPHLLSLIQHMAVCPDTRRGVIALWDNDEDTQNLKSALKDYPCTLTLQFLERRECLHMFVNMRSNDAWLGLPYDAFCFMGLQRIVAWCLRIAPGAYYHNASSLHLYDKNRESAKEAYISGRFRASALFPRDLEICPADFLANETPEDRFRILRYKAHRLFMRLDGKPALLETVETAQGLLQECGSHTFLSFLAAMAFIPYYVRNWKSYHADAGGLFEAYSEEVRDLVQPNALHAIQHLLREDLCRNFERAVPR